MPDDIGDAEASRRGNGAGGGTPVQASQSTTGAGGAARVTGDAVASKAGGRSEADAAGGGLSGPAERAGKGAADAGGTGASKGPAKAIARPADAGAQPPSATGGAERRTDDAAPGKEGQPDKPSAARRFRQGVSRVLGLAPSGRPAERTLEADQINEFRALALEEATSEDVSESRSSSRHWAPR